VAHNLHLDAYFHDCKNFLKFLPLSFQLKTAIKFRSSVQRGNGREEKKKNSPTQYDHTHCTLFVEEDILRRPFIVYFKKYNEKIISNYIAHVDFVQSLINTLQLEPVFYF